MSQSPQVGFIGLGTMGLPMALNLARSGVALTVWNRSPAPLEILGEAGATISPSAAHVFATSETIILMLANEAATDAVLARGTSAFADRVQGRRIIAMGTMPPDYSRALDADIRAAGGRYIEAPVSGSRKPAEAGRLVAMVAGNGDEADVIRPLLAPMCREVFFCGAVPSALTMKLAVNIFLITQVTGLVEATHFAASHGLDLKRFVAVLDAGPMASEVSRIKAAKLETMDFERQAGISDVLKNSRLITEAARAASVAAPLMDICLALYGETESLGLGEDDMVAVVRAFEQRSGLITAKPPSAT